MQKYNWLSPTEIPGRSLSLSIPSLSPFRPLYTGQGRGFGPSIQLNQGTHIYVSHDVWMKLLPEEHSLCLSLSPLLSLIQTDTYSFSNTHTHQTHSHILSDTHMFTYTYTYTRTHKQCIRYAIASWLSPLVTSPCPYLASPPPAGPPRALLPSIG